MIVGVLLPSECWILLRGCQDCFFLTPGVHLPNPLGPFPGHKYLWSVSSALVPCSCLNSSCPQKLLEVGQFPFLYFSFARKRSSLLFLKQCTPLSGPVHVRALSLCPVHAHVCSLCCSSRWVSAPALPWPQPSLLVLLGLMGENVWKGCPEKKNVLFL